MHNDFKKKEKRYSSSLTEYGRGQAYWTSPGTDKVGHERLIHKLEFYRIQHKTSKYIESLIANRIQTIVLEGENSNLSNVHPGVLQGLVLGPCLFNLRFSVRLFADNTTVYIALSNKMILRLYRRIREE